MVKEIHQRFGEPTKKGIRDYIKKLVKEKSWEEKIAINYSRTGTDKDLEKTYETRAENIGKYIKFLKRKYQIR